MTDRKEAKGFEAAFIKSWGDWDMADTAVFQFNDVEFTNVARQGLGMSKADCVVFSLDSMLMEVYDGEEDGPVKTCRLNLSAEW